MGLFEVKTIALRRNFHVARFAVVEDSRNFNVCPSCVKSTEQKLHEVLLILQKF